MLDCLEPVPTTALAVLEPVRRDAQRKLFSDADLVEQWLRRRPATTARVYARAAAHFLATLPAGVTLRQVGHMDLEDYVEGLAHLAPASQCVRLACIKSLLSFGNRLGFLPVNAGVTVSLKAPICARHERILSESDLHKLLLSESKPRNKALLTVLYASGCRLSEVLALRWRDVQQRDEAGQISVLGKGGKVRSVLLPASTWRLIVALPNAGPDAVIFAGPGGRRLDSTSGHRIVKAAARRAGLSDLVSAHWLRHAHASHSLDRGAPLSLVQSTLGHSSIATTGRYLHSRPGDSSGRYLGL